MGGWTVPAFIGHGIQGALQPCMGHATALIGHGIQGAGSTRNPGDRQYTESRLQAVHGIQGAGSTRNPGGRQFMESRGQAVHGIQGAGSAQPLVRACPACPASSSGMPKAWTCLACIERHVVAPPHTCAHSGTSAKKLPLYSHPCPVPLSGCAPPHPLTPISGCAPSLTPPSPSSSPPPPSCHRQCTPVLLASFHPEQLSQLAWALAKVEHYDSQVGGAL